MVREMIGGCCVCLDERGWNENPLVYCDGIGCSVAVHQACYGIVKVPSGPWFCCKCRSQERVARVKCELCPRREGALKRTDTGGWAHVVCALYIPEVRFGNVSTMEPIIFSSVPHDRFMKNCYICEERHKESKGSSGACMSCHKAGCKLAFHVTCAQSKRQLCEEASVNGHVQYVGYCSIHWKKRLKNLASNSNSTPSVTSSNSQIENNKHWKEKRPRNRTESTSSTNSIETTTLKPTRVRKPKNIDIHTNENAQQQTNNSSLPTFTCSTVNDSIEDISPVQGDEALFSSITGTKENKAAIPNGQAKQKNSNTKSSSVNFKSSSASTKSSNVNGININDKTNLNTPLNTPVYSPISNKETENDSKPKSLNNITISHSSSESGENTKNIYKKRKLVEKERFKKKRKLKSDTEKDNKVSKTVKEKKKKEKSLDGTAVKKKEGKTEKKKYPQPSKLGLLENGKVSSWDISNPFMKETPDNFQAFLEHQWNQSSQFITSKAQHFDVASLLGCLHQLKSDNMKLEKKLTHLQSRKDRLLGLNARLASSFAESTMSAQESQSKDKVPLSTMLSNLNESEKRASGVDEEEASEMVLKKSKIEFESPDKLFSDTEHAVPSPDLAMLAAASAKFDSRMSSRQRKSIAATQRDDIADEKPPIFQLSSSSVVGASSVLPPHTSTMEGGGQSSNLLNGVLHLNHRKGSYQQEYLEKQHPST